MKKGEIFGNATQTQSTLVIRLSLEDFTHVQRAFVSHPEHNIHQAQKTELKLTSKLTLDDM